jgi:membrane-bound lytic murein transglycosylase B
LIRSMAAALLLGVTLHCAAAEGYLGRDDVQRFVTDMVEKHGFERRELDVLFSKLRRQGSVLRAMTPPAEAPQRSWQVYRSMFVNAQRIEAGRRFREANAEALTRASATYGVPESIILAIIGVETVYGRNTGTYRVADALATLAFDFPPRADYFRSELEQFLLFARDERVDVLGLRGSFAGAIGIPQFMPGTFRRFAVDFDGDGRRDLVSSPADAIGSVANFLKEHGWRPGEAVAVRTQVTGQDYRKLLDGAVKPAYLPRELAAAGVAVPEDVPADRLCTLLELQSPGLPNEYWIGFENFYVVTRYNRSTFYALSVLDLSRALENALAATR